MNSKLFLGSLFLLGGCCAFDCCKDQQLSTIEGNWGIALPFEEYSAGHMILSRDCKGEPSALVLTRWSSPVKAKEVKFEGNRFSFKVMDSKWYYAGQVIGDTISGHMTRFDSKTGLFTDKSKPFSGWRNPEIVGGVDMKEAKFGEPIDLLAGGLDSWYAKESNRYFGWTFKDGVLSNRIKREKGVLNANLITKREDFMDFKLSYDVRVLPKCNSGVYLRGRYEIQTIDSYGKKLDCHNMAAYYGRVKPTVSAEKPAGEWQHVEVTLFRRHLTVVLNGQTIHDTVPVIGITGGAIDAREFVPGPMYIQGDHSDADYKNMILTPILNGCPTCCKK